MKAFLVSACSHDDTKSPKAQEQLKVCVMMKVIKIKETNLKHVTFLKHIR